jgi:glycosyltransferase involved in cell wall biosynthesis
MRILIIGQVWPEPSSTAAGRRMHELIELFHEAGHSITFATAAQKTPYSQLPAGIAIDTHEIELNSSSFDVWVKSLNPEMVVFDRFMTEEQFGWRIAQNVPQALRVLDTEDLHFLRQHRENTLGKDLKNTSNQFHTPLAFREIAAIYRCDLSLIISEFEMQLLQTQFNVPSELLHYLPFCRKRIETEDVSGFADFEQRNGFATIGSFRHAPNRDAVIYLKEQIWPLIRSKKPNATICVYGSYSQNRDEQLNDLKTGFMFCGRATNALETISKHRVLLAPLRFGAGLKGKIVDAMQSGTPFLSSSIGIEGMENELLIQQLVANNPDEFAQKAIALHDDCSAWQSAQNLGISVFNNLFCNQLQSESMLHRFNDLHRKLAEHRVANFTGAMLLHHRTMSTRYLSKWIEEKNKNASQT